VKKVLDTIQRFQVLLGIITMAAGVLAVVIWGFGDTLGIDPGFRKKISEGALLARDADENGTPDIIDNLMNSDDVGSD